MKTQLSTATRAWDDDSGDWKNLQCASQFVRYEFISNLIRHCGAASVLDVGCGEAVLRKFLSPSIQYLGIEPSGKAAAGCTDVIVSTAEAFNAGLRKWDCIVFNEMLYYSPDPRTLLEKYSAMLTQNGRIVISIYQKQETRFERVKRWLFLRRPSNVSCTRLVRNFLIRKEWFSRDGLVAGRWYIWDISPAGKVKR